MFSFRLLLSLVTLGLLTSVAAQERAGQATSSPPLTLSGVLTKAGAGVQGATVEAFNLKTREVKAATTDSAGRFSIDGLPPGNYRLRVSQVAEAPSMIVLEVDVELNEATPPVKLSLDPSQAVTQSTGGGTRCTRIPRASKSRSLMRGIKRVFGKGKK
jgi:hypothetical protein